MLVYFVKWIHVLIALTLLGTTTYCMILVAAKKKLPAIFNLASVLTVAHKILLYLVLFAVLTGTLLIYPKHYSFQTHWIQAAYFFGGVFFLMVLGMLFLKHKSHKIALILYFVLLTILIIVSHDAVNKTTFLF